jgi:sulfur-carrier protein
MPRVVFTPNLARHINCEPKVVAGTKVRDVLEAAFADNARARGYVLDDQGAVRKHVVIFVDGVAIKDRVGLSDSVPENGEVYVMQALSGG